MERGQRVGLTREAMGRRARANPRAVWGPNHLPPPSNSAVRIIGGISSPSSIKQIMFVFNGRAFLVTGSRAALMMPSQEAQVMQLLIEKEKKWNGNLR